MISPAKTPVVFIGCDVGKASIIVFDSRGTHTRSVRNRAEDLALFAASLDPTCFVVC
jgi:hypothetical protein